MKAYYNENDPKAAAWLRELIAAQLIADGDVDERSICEVQASDLIGYGQVHLFAGIGGWSHAFRLAGIPDDFPAWSCSCPCQPFSQAGEQKGFNDERHLWPEACRLIRERSPAVVFGEQVASELGRVWLSGVHADLEKLAYAVGAADLCAASVGAPHERQRLYWLAYSRHAQMRRTAESRDAESGRPFSEIAGCCHAGRLEHAARDGRYQRRPESDGWRTAGRCGGHGRSVITNGGTRRMGDAECPRPQGRGRPELRERGGEWITGKASSHGGVGNPESYDERRQRLSGTGDRRNVETRGSSAWSNFDILPCRDGKARRIESRAQPLADGLSGDLVHLRDFGAPEAEILTEVQETFPLIKNASARAMRLRGYGNAIVPPLAAIFIRSAFEAIEMAQTEKVEVFEQSTLF